MFGSWPGRDRRGTGPRYVGSQIGDGNVQYNSLSIPQITLTLPGIVLTVGGSILALVSFAGWASIGFRIAASHAAVAFPGPSLPSGIPLAACYFIGAAGGGLIAGIGRMMVSSAGRKRFAASICHAVIGVIIICMAAYAINYAAAGTPYSELLPHFAKCPWEAAGGPWETASANPGPPAELNLTIDEWTCKRKP